MCRPSQPTWLPSPARSRPESQSHVTATAVPKHSFGPTQESQTGSHTPSPPGTATPPPHPPSKPPRAAAPSHLLHLLHYPRSGLHTGPHGPLSTHLSCPWPVRRQDGLRTVRYGHRGFRPCTSLFPCTHPPRGLPGCGDKGHQRGQRPPMVPGLVYPHEPVGRSHKPMEQL